MRRFLTSLVMASVVAFVPVPAMVASGATLSPSSDFNGDGFADLAVAATGESSYSGAVHVLYGSSGGLTATGSQLWTQDSPDVPGVARPEEQFGFVLAGGDFDGDGFDDLAIGVFADRIRRVWGAGAVNVLYGSSSGLTATGSQLWSQDSAGVAGRAEWGDYFGYVAAAGDLNGDGFADLAVGAPFEGVGRVEEAGAVNVLYGSSSGLTATGSQLWSQDSPDVAGRSGRSDTFGSWLTANDFDGDGAADLGIGVAGDRIGGDDFAGSVRVLYGSPGGVTATGGQMFTKDSPNVPAEAEPDDLLGLGVAGGDLNRDGFDDLVAYANGAQGAGDLTVLYGSAAGVTATGSQLWTQDSPDVPGDGERFDGFGWDVAVGDLNGDGFDDLVAGIPFENTAGVRDAGAAVVLYGSAAGVTATGSQLFDQNTPGIVDEVGDDSARFGWSVAARDLNGDGRADLAVGAPGENEGRGAANVLYGSSSGLSTTGNQLWTQDSSGIEGEGAADDGFGSSWS